MKPAIIRPDLELKREIRNVSERNVIYIRLTGDYKLNDYGGPGAVYSNSSKNNSCRWEISARFASITMIRK